MKGTCARLRSRRVVKQMSSAVKLTFWHNQQGKLALAFPQKWQPT